MMKVSENILQIDFSIPGEGRIWTKQKMLENYHDLVPRLKEVIET